MSNIIDNEIKYCTNCGSANKKSAIICVECEKKINEKHRPFYDFLQKRIKGKVTGFAEAGLFKLIKNYLVSHLYGAVLAISVVTTSTVVIATATPYIKTVSVPDPVVAAFLDSKEVADYDGNLNEEQITEEKNEEQIVEEKNEDKTEEKEEIKIEEKNETSVAQSEALDSEDQKIRRGDAEYVVSHYYDRVMERMYAHEGYVSDSDTLKLSQIYAENNVPGFSFPKVHDMMSKAIPLGMYDFEGLTYENIGFSNNTFKYDKDVTSTVAKNLYNSGFKVTEANYYISAYRKKSDYVNNPANPQEQEGYRIVLVEYNGEWYIAEDVLISRVKGQTYDVYSQYGPNAIISYDSDGNVEMYGQQ